MNRFPFFLLLFLLPLLAAAQEKRVYTVAGGGTSGLGDGGPATNGRLTATEGIWIDGNCNLYISDKNESRVRCVNLSSGIITTFAGKGDGTPESYGFGGDGGPATNAKINGPYGLFADGVGNVYFADGRNSRIRRVEAATGIISTFAGGGTDPGDNIPATNAILNTPGNVYIGSDGYVYIGEIARIRKVDVSTGIITTVAGTGTFGYSGDGGMATNAQIYGAQGMMMDATGNLVFADRANSRIRKINSTSGIITTVAGTTQGFSGDGGLATNAQLAGPISVVIDEQGNVIIGDNGNNRIRVVDLNTGIITSVAGVGSSRVGSELEGALATEAEIHPEFLNLDRSGNLYFSNYGWKVRRITGFKPGLASSGSNCALLSVDQFIEKPFEITILPNPAKDIVTLIAPAPFTGTCSIYNQLGQLVLEKNIANQKSEFSISNLPNGFYYLILKGMQGTKTLSFTKN